MLFTKLEIRLVGEDNLASCIYLVNVLWIALRLVTFGLVVRIPETLIIK